MFKYILIYGLSLFGILISIQFINYNFWINTLDLSSYVSIIAFLFLVLGIFLAKRFFSEKIVIEKEILVTKSAEINFQAASKFNISTRELEVLALLAQGCTNKEISEKLFISMNTVKTHISNLYIKLDVSNRTKAIAKAQELSLLVTHT